MIAAWRGHSLIVAELVRVGAQIDAQDQVYNSFTVCVIYYIWFLGNPRFITSIILEAPREYQHELKLLMEI